MFDIGFWEMVFVVIITLIVIGPERLPGAVHIAEMWVKKARRVVSDVQWDIKQGMDQHDTLRRIIDLKQNFTGTTQEINKDVTKER